MNTPSTTYLFFTGKGGVGKTSLACATALQLADAGKMVLLVSTDPASNLSDVLDSPVTEVAQAVHGQPRLFAINIDPEVAAEEYRERVVAPIRDILPAPEIIRLTESLSGACTTEIASFDEFARFIAGEGDAALYDVIVFDTAPTGHTLRLLELPAAWSSFALTNPAGASCLGPSSALKSSQQRYQTVVERLRDPNTTTFYIVTRPDKHALAEAARTSEELTLLGMTNQQLLVNGVFQAFDHSDPVARKIADLAKQVLTGMPPVLAKLEHATFPLLPYNVLGLPKLRSLLDAGLRQGMLLEMANAIPVIDHHLPGLSKLVDELASGAGRGLVMTMGKGGVGKTITAAAIATLLARKGFEVHLTTTDPAGHIRDFMGQLPELPGNLTIDQIDPHVETQRYMDKVMAQKGKGLDAEGKRLLAEDLKSPCTEEVAVFHAFSKAIQKAKRQFVVIDTAPTGHTLLLLDTTGSYHREVLRHTNLQADHVKTPYMYLQDPEFAKVILVSLPETTPMREAASLQADLQRSSIQPYAWVVNQCLSAVPSLTDPLLRQRAANEGAIISQIEQSLADRVFEIPYLVSENPLAELVHERVEVPPQ